MSFEAEVIPLFIGGAGIVCLSELIFGCFMLNHQKQIRNRFVAHVACMAIALVFLIRCIFGSRLGMQSGILSISNSVNIGMFGIFWAVSIYLLLSVLRMMTEKGKTNQ